MVKIGCFGNGRKDEKDLRIERVVVHVTENEKLMLRELAAKKGMDVSTFIRTYCIYNKVSNFIKEK